MKDLPKRKCSSVDTALGSNLAYFRKLAGFTQQYVADALNLNRTTYTKYETGASEPSIEILKKIADIFDIDVASLLEDESKTKIVLSDAAGDDGLLLSAEDRNLLRKYHMLEREDKEEVNKLLNTLTDIEN